MSTRFFICRRCGKLVEVIDDTKAEMSCCGEPMEELVPNTTDAAVEKHVPVIAVNGNEVSVKVGEVPHPMLEEHHIEWIYLLTTAGCQRKNLSAGDAPEATFIVSEGTPVSVCAYCNLHGLWKADI